MKTKNVLSGMQSSGTLHLGNYIGAISTWKKIINENPNWNYYFMVADLHSLTSAKNPNLLKQNIEDLITCYLSCGIDFEKENINIFQQSSIYQHTEFSWILSTITPIGWMERMTQFKDKSKSKDAENINLGLFTYPVLMAADILLYDTDLVPVGSDQKQHVELTRDIAEKFNRQYECSEIKSPDSLILENGRVMSLLDGTKKMSKSDLSEFSRILLTDSNDDVVKKISKAKTDSISEIYYDKELRPEISNLIYIFSVLSGIKINDVRIKFEGKKTGEFKKELSELIIQELSPIRQKILNIKKDFDVSLLVKKGNEICKNISEEKMKKVRKIIGIS